MAPQFAFWRLTQAASWVREVNPELAEDVLDVRIDRALGQYQLFGDLPVPEALGHQLGDLPLSPGQRVGGDLVGWTGTSFLATAIASVTDSSRPR